MPSRHRRRMVKCRSEATPWIQRLLTHDAVAFAAYQAERCGRCLCPRPIAPGIAPVGAVGGRRRPWQDDVRPCAASVATGRVDLRKGRYGRMTMVIPLASAVEQRVRRAMASALPSEAAGADPLVRPSDYADFQANGIFPLAKTLRVNPRELAARVAGTLPADDLIASCEVAGPGFLNLTVTDAAILRQLVARLGDPRLGIPASDAGTVAVIDYSQPNIAKEMHVGHLRSTIIGDALVRVLEFRGSKVVRQNHVGDWGTQFGMLIQYL